MAQISSTVSTMKGSCISAALLTYEEVALSLLFCCNPNFGETTLSRSRWLASQGPVKKPSSTSFACHSFMSCSRSPENTVAAMERSVKRLCHGPQKILVKLRCTHPCWKKHLTRKPPTYWKASGHLCRHLCIRVRNLFQESFEKDRAFAIQYAPDMWVHQPSAVGFGFFQVGAHGHELLGK